MRKSSRKSTSSVPESAWMNVPPTASSSPSGAAASASARVASVLAAIVAECASGQPLEQNVLRSLEMLRAALDAPECAIWLHTPEGLVRAWTVGEDGAMDAAAVEARLADTGAPPADAALAVAR